MVLIAPAATQSGATTLIDCQPCTASRWPGSGCGNIVCRRLRRTARSRRWWRVPRGKPNAGDGALWCTRMLDADRPRAAVRSGPAPANRRRVDDAAGGAIALKQPPLRSAAYSLPKAAEIDLHACVRQHHRLRRSLHGASRSAPRPPPRMASDACAAEVPRPAQYPEVISNRPPLGAWSCAAKSSSCEVSASASTAAPLPAAALMRETMLSGR